MSTFDAAVDGVNNGGTTNTLSWNHTFTTNANRLAFINIEGDFTTGVDDFVSCTVGGVAATLINKYTGSLDRINYLCAIVAPGTGLRSIVATFGSSHNIAGGSTSYYDAAQSLIFTIVTHASTSGTTLTTSLTPSATTTKIALFEMTYNGNNPPSAGTNATRRAFDATFGAWGFFENSTTPTAGVSYSMTTTRTSDPTPRVIGHVMVAFETFTPPPPESGYEHARSNVCRSGVAIAGLVPYQLSFKVNGVERGFLINSFQITHTVGQPSTCAFKCTGFSVQAGQQVIVANDGVNSLLFGGVTLPRRYQNQGPVQIFYDTQCADWQWLMDKDAVVFESFDNVAVNVAIRRILSTYVDPALGITAGEIPSTLGTVTLQLIGNPPSDAIARICSNAKAIWELTPDKTINAYQTEPSHAQTLTLTNASRVKNLWLGDNISQLRNRIWYAGGGAQTTAFVPAGAVTLPINECGWYSSSGGEGLATWLRFSYTGKSVDSGPGSLTGVTWLNALADVPLNTSVYVFTRLDDATRQSAFASRLGGGLTGIKIFYQQDGNASLSETAGRAQQHRDFYGDPMYDATYETGFPDRLETEERHYKPGRLVNVNYTNNDGENVAGSFRISSVVITGLGDVKLANNPYGVSSLALNRAYTLRPGVRQGVVDLLIGAV